MKYYIFFSIFFIGIMPFQAITADEISQQLRQCDKYLKANDLTSSKNGEEKTALYCYKDVLAKAPNNLKAVVGLKEIETRYVKWAKRAMKRGQKTKIERYLNSLRLVDPNSQVLAELEAELYPNRQATPPPVAEQTPQESTKSPEKPKQAKIADLGQIYEAINTTECLTWPSSEIKEKGGKNGWGSFYPKKGDTGNIISEMKHCHLEDNIYVLKIEQHYVAITTDGVQVIE